MRDKSSKGSVKPGAPPRVGPRGSWGTGGSKAEPGRLSLARLGPDGKRGGELPNGLVVGRYRRVAMYRTTSFDSVVRLVAELLFKVSRIARGSVVYLNGRRMRMLLGLDAPFHPVDLSVVYSLLVRFGFEVVRRRGKYVVIRMDNPIMREVKGARSFDEVLEIVKKHLNNGG